MGRQKEREVRKSNRKWIEYLQIGRERNQARKEELSNRGEKWKEIEKKKPNRETKRRKETKKGAEKERD